MVCMSKLRRYSQSAPWEAMCKVTTDIYHIFIVIYINTFVFENKHKQELHNRCQVCILAALLTRRYDVCCISLRPRTLDVSVKYHFLIVINNIYLFDHGVAGPFEVSPFVSPSCGCLLFDFLITNRLTSQVSTKPSQPVDYILSTGCLTWRPLPDRIPAPINDNN